MSCIRQTPYNIQRAKMTTLQADPLHKDMATNGAAGVVTMGLNAVKETLHIIIIISMLALGSRHPCWATTTISDVQLFHLAT